MELVQTDSTIEIAIVENPYAHTKNTKFPPRKKVRFTEFNLVIILVDMCFIVQYGTVTKVNARIRLSFHQRFLSI